MALMDFIKKQFIDIIQWTEESDGTLAWRFPMADMEIQNGASLTVRESQLALFVNEGKVADVFGPGTHKLSTQTHRQVEIEPERIIDSVLLDQAIGLSDTGDIELAASRVDRLAFEDRAA